jgi:hypothetical protein
VTPLLAKTLHVVQPAGGILVSGSFFTVWLLRRISAPFWHAAGMNNSMHISLINHKTASYTCHDQGFRVLYRLDGRVVLVCVANMAISVLDY